MTKEQYKDFSKYFDALVSIYSCAGFQAMIRKLIELARAGASKDEVIEAHNRWHQTNTAPRGFFYSADDARIRTGRDLMDTLDYFGVEYPKPPESIEQLLAPKKEDSA